MESQTENKKQEDKKRQPVKGLSRYILIALIVLVTYGLGMIFFFVLYRYHTISVFFQQLMRILQPIIIGLGLAYLLNPVMVFIEQACLRLWTGKLSTPKKERKLARGVGTAGAILFLFLIIYLLIEMIVPQLIESIQKMLVSLPEEMNNLTLWVSDALKGDNIIIQSLNTFISSTFSYVENILETQLLPLANTYITSVTIGMINVIKVFFNVIIGVIVSIYLLTTKETFIGQGKKIIYTLMPIRAGNKLLEVLRRSHRIFSGFISGKLIDSLIIGVLCYVVLLILNMPYSLLVAVVIGATNVIPFFGPFIGAIPCVILIGLASPIHGLYFLIWIVILQQLDGNIIGPKILGDSTGLSPFWVVFSILVGSGLFGIIGMILGVPTFAVIYYLIGEVVSFILNKKKLPKDTISYITMDNIDTKTGEIVFLPQNTNPKTFQKKTVKEQR